MRQILTFLFIGLLSSVSYGADFTTKATSAILMDYDTGTVVFEKKGDELMATCHSPIGSWIWGEKSYKVLSPELYRV